MEELKEIMKKHIIFFEYLKNIILKLLILILVFNYSSLFAQIPCDTLWTKTIGGTSSEYGSSIQQTSDDGYIISGRTYSYGAGNTDAWLIKTDDLGNVDWFQTYGDTGPDQANCVKQTIDGGYIITGSKYIFDELDSDLWLIKTDENGNIEWEHTYGGTDYDSGRSVIQTLDENYLVAGSTTDNFYTDGPLGWVLKTDAQGNEIWNNIFGTYFTSEVFESIEETLDGGYILAGSKPYYTYSPHEAWLVKIDEEGNQEWEEYFGDEGYDSFKSVIQTTDGGYIMSGSLDTAPFGEGHYKAWLVKTDSYGNFEWEQTYGDSDEYNAGRSAMQTLDEGYFLAGWIENLGSQRDVFLTKTDCDGNIQAVVDFGGNNNDAAYAAITSNDGSYIVTGYTTSYGAGSSDLWLLKIGSIYADFTANPTSGPAPLEVQFEDQSYGDISNWQWDFDNDGIIDSNEQNPTYTYSEDGLYTVSLTVSDETNTDTEIKVDYINVSVSGVESETISLETTLLGNYPNPFNPTTTISFSILDHSNIELSIYNIKGQKVKQLISDQLSTGEHSIIWNGDDNDDKQVSSGVYLYKLIIDGKSEAVMKCLLLK
jgi:PKD repeat protein